ncbi:hypothetical protein CCP3SC15_760001 [Gammaproteobacteria bacterium]
MVRCAQAYLTDPVKLLRSPFIRPEDVGVYRKLGIDIIKLSDRSESTAFLLNTACAYLQEYYHGNLFDLIFRSGRKFRAGLGRQRAEIADLALPVHIANDVLSRLKFIERISEGKEPELSRFYQQATQEAVTLPDDDTLSNWRGILSRCLGNPDGRAE